MSLLQTVLVVFGVLAIYAMGLYSSDLKRGLLAWRDKLIVESYQRNPPRFCKECGGKVRYKRYPPHTAELHDEGGRRYKYEQAHCLENAETFAEFSREEVVTLKSSSSKRNPPAA